MDSSSISCFSNSTLKLLWVKKHIIQPGNLLLINRCNISTQDFLLLTGECRPVDDIEEHEDAEQSQSVKGGGIHEQ